MSSRLFHTTGSSHAVDLDDHYCHEVMLVLSHEVVGARLTVVSHCHPEKCSSAGHLVSMKVDQIVTITCRQVLIRYGVSLTV